MRFSSWAGAEKFAADLNFVKTVKRQTDTKTQWNTLQVSLFYPFHLRKSYVQRYLAFADLSNMFLIQSLLYFNGRL